MCKAITFKLSIDTVFTDGKKEKDRGFLVSHELSQERERIGEPLEQQLQEW